MVNVVVAIGMRVLFFAGTILSIIGVLSTQSLHAEALYCLLIMAFTALYMAMELKWDRRSQ